jgi:hypothetical protein
MEVLMGNSGKSSINGKFSVAMFDYRRVATSHVWHEMNGNCVAT